MTTRLDRPVRREVYAPRHGALIATMRPEGILLREKGRRKSYLLTWGITFQQAVQRSIAAEKAEKKARRALRRAAR